MKKPNRPQSDRSAPTATSRRTKATAEAVGAAALETMALAVDSIRDQIEALASGKVVPDRRDPGSVIASLAAKLASIFEAARKSEAARLKLIQNISPSMAMAWVRTLDPGERAQFLREAALIDEIRSGLG